jgi:transcriptional regulator with GAF, ATPase, and Fis domain
MSVADDSAGRVGAAISRHAQGLVEAVSFKAGCTVVAAILGDALAADDLTLSIRSTFPPFEVHVCWQSGTPTVIVDSREAHFADLRPATLDATAAWTFDIPDRMAVELRTGRCIDIGDAELRTIVSLLSPYLELTRRMERVHRASGLLDLAVDWQITRHSEAVFTQIVRRVGETVRCPAAMYILADDQDIEHMHVYESAFAPQAAQHIFTSIRQIADGPIDRAIQAPPLASPTSMTSMALDAPGRTANQLIEQLQVSDYVAVKMLYHGNAIGVLIVTAMHGRTLTSDEIAMVASLAWSAGLAIPIAQQQRITRRRLQESEMLRHLANVNHQHRDPDEALRMATNVARIIFGADYVAIGTIGHEDYRLSYHSVSGNQTTEHLQLERVIETDLVREWVRHPVPYVLTDDVISSPVMQREMRVHRAERLRTSMSAGVRVAGKQHTLFLMTGFRRATRFDEEELHFANALTQTIAMSL